MCPTPSWTSHTHEFLASVMEGVHLFQGITDATMTHGEGWQYIELGRYIERASATAALLDVHYRDFPGARDQPAEVGEYVEWVALLRSCCAFEAYCRHYTADLRSIRIAEFLILNPDFPRSIRFGAGRIQASLKAIAALTGRGGRAERLAGRLLASLDYGQVDEIVGDQLPALSRRHRPAVEPDQRRRLPAVHRLPHRRGAVGLTHAPLRDPSRHPLQLRHPGEREPDGSAHAAAQRGRATLPALRARHSAPRARARLPRLPRQLDPPLRRAGTPRPSDAHRHARTSRWTRGRRCPSRCPIRHGRWWIRGRSRASTSTSGIRAALRCGTTRCSTTPGGLVRPPSGRTTR